MYSVKSVYFYNLAFISASCSGVTSGAFLPSLKIVKNDAIISIIYIVICSIVEMMDVDLHTISKIVLLVNKHILHNSSNTSINDKITIIVYVNDLIVSR